MGRDVAAERADIDRVVEGRTLCSVFAETAARFAEGEALKSRARDGTWSALTWIEYRERVRAAALGLHSLGIQPGTFGVILCRNRAEHVIADMGLVHARAAPVSLYNTLSPEQIAYITNHCGARVAFVEDEAALEKFRAIRDRLPNLERVVVIDGDASDEWTIGWDELLETGRAAHDRVPDAFDEMWRAVMPDDLLTLIYTSGTTGPPKGVMNTHRNVLWDIESLRRVMELGSGDRVISYLPLAHAADRFLTLWQGIVRGFTTHYCPDIAQILQTLVEVRPTFFGAVPRVWEKMYAGLNAAVVGEADEARRNAIMSALAVARDCVAREQRDDEIPADLSARREASEPVFAAIREKIGLDQGRIFITGAAPTPPEVLEFFAAIGVNIAEVWGMSELSAIGTMNPRERIRIGSIGVTLPGVEAQVAADGELLIRGGLVMKGYYRDEEKTAETLDYEGWLHTGDVATIDEGYLRIVDRKKELIITAGGKNISPANIESLLKEHPLIGQACVIGDNRQYLSALIVLDQEVAPAWAKGRGIEASSVAEIAGNALIAAEIEKAVAAVNARVSRVENVRRYTILPSEWTAESEELTPTLKLKRRVIIAKYADVIESMY
ncbi:MAG: long-chain fatty acid--CoA ligase [Actinomycetota bacterium]|nr:AMP-binding protein [Actinomycetota bacterium]